MAEDGHDGLTFDYELNATLVWPWLREMLLKRPEFVAEMTGIPEVARLADLPKRGDRPPH